MPALTALFDVNHATLQATVSTVLFLLIKDIIIFVMKIALYLLMPHRMELVYLAIVNVLSVQVVQQIVHHVRIHINFNPIILVSIIVKLANIQIVMIFVKIV
jgi:hypothetical protein